MTFARLLQLYAACAVLLVPTTAIALPIAPTTITTRTASNVHATSFAGPILTTDMFIATPLASHSPTAHFIADVARTNTSPSSNSMSSVVPSATLPRVASPTLSSYGRPPSSATASRIVTATTSPGAASNTDRPPPTIAPPASIQGVTASTSLQASDADAADFHMDGTSFAIGDSIHVRSTEAAGARVGAARRLSALSATIAISALSESSHISSSYIPDASAMLASSAYAPALTTLSDPAGSMTTRDARPLPPTAAAMSSASASVLRAPGSAAHSSSRLSAQSGVGSGFVASVDSGRVLAPHAPAFAPLDSNNSTTPHESSGYLGKGLASTTIFSIVFGVCLLIAVHTALRCLWLRRRNSNTPTAPRTPTRSRASSASFRHVSYGFVMAGARMSTSRDPWATARALELIVPRAAEHPPLASAVVGREREREREPAPPCRPPPAHTRSPSWGRPRMPLLESR